MKKSKSTLLTALMLVLTLTTLLGCTQQTAEPTATPATTTAPPSAVTDAPTETPNFNETGLPIVNEKVTYSVFIKQQGGGAATESDVINEFDIVKMAEEDTNVHIEWVCVPTDVMQERITLLLTSGDYPDAFSCNTISYADIKKYAADGIFIRLNDLYDKYMINTKASMEEIGFNLEPYMKDMEGNIYAFMGGIVSYRAGNSLSINTSWIERLGLTVPSTTEEFYSVLKAFYENDANGNGDSKDEIPFSFTSQAYFYDFFGIFGAYPGIYINNNDEVDYGPVQPEFKEAVKYLNRLYSEKLIDQEAFTQDRAAFLSKGKIQPTLYGAFLNWRPGEVVTEEVSQAEYQAALMLSHNGVTNTWPVQNAFGVSPQLAITDKAENPEVLARWCDYFHEPTISSLVRFGGSPTWTTINEDGSLTANPYPEGLTLGDWFIRDGHNQNLPRISIPRAASYYYSTSPSGREKMAIDEYYAPYFAPEIPKLSSMPCTAEENDRFLQLTTDINLYRDQMVAVWATGESDIDADWENYLTELNKLGLEEYISLNQTLYDRFKELS